MPLAKVKFREGISTYQAKISKALKGIYIGIKSKNFGNIASQETKDKISIKKKWYNYPLFGKNHKDTTKELMRNKALNRNKK